MSSKILGRYSAIHLAAVSYYAQACKRISTVESVCAALNALLDRVKKSQSAVRDFTSNQLPVIIQGLLWFNGADPILQSCTMQVAARCLVHFTTATLQFRNHLKKWAQGGLFSEQLMLSQVFIISVLITRVDIYIREKAC